MLSQRAGDGENPAEIQFRKWTAKGTMKSREEILIQLSFVSIMVFPWFKRFCLSGFRYSLPSIL